MLRFIDRFTLGFLSNISASTPFLVLKSSVYSTWFVSRMRILYDFLYAAKDWKLDYAENVVVITQQSRFASTQFFLVLNSVGDLVCLSGNI